MQPVNAVCSNRREQWGDDFVCVVAWVAAAAAAALLLLSAAAATAVEPACAELSEEVPLSVPLLLLQTVQSLVFSLLLPKAHSSLVLQPLHYISNAACFMPCCGHF
jgi:hypothetical protein